MKAILYTLHLLEPVLVAQAGAGEENSATGLPYIPGSALRGALAAAWIRDHTGVDLATDAAARPLFLDATVFHLNAYPLHKGKRTLPQPASWMIEKESATDSTEPIYDFAVDASTALTAPKSPKGLFCLVEDVEDENPPYAKEYSAHLLSPSRFEQLHISLKEVNRRDDSNTIFRYDALAAGQRFAGAIVGPDDADLSDLQKILAEGELTLGSAQMAGYGRMAVENIREVANWREYTPYTPFDPERLVLTLLSPTLIRNSRGQAGWDGGESLARALGVAADSGPLEAYGQLAFMGGYNRKWRMPLPQEWALAAGNVFVFRAQDVDPAKLQMALDQGIGERRAEGFGRIAAHWQAGAQIQKRNDEVEKPDSPALSDQSQDLAQAMAQRRLRLLLDARMVERVNAYAESLQRPPQNAQLSAIRQATLATLTAHGPQDGLQPLTDHLKNLKKAGRTQLERCRVGNQTLFQWLSERADSLDVKEQLLGSDSLPMVAGKRASLDLPLRQEYTARLIDGVMQLTARRNTEAKV